MKFPTIFNCFLNYYLEKGRLHIGFEWHHYTIFYTKNLIIWFRSAIQKFLDAIFLCIFKFACSRILKCHWISSKHGARSKCAERFSDDLDRSTKTTFGDNPNIQTQFALTGDTSHYYVLQAEAEGLACLVWSLGESCCLLSL